MNYLFRTADHPQANGRREKAGELAYILQFRLEDNAQLTVKLGKQGIANLRESLDSLDTQQTHRADGWPLCPRCGEDTLYSALVWDKADGTEPPSLAEYIAAGLKCSACEWAQRAAT